MNIKSFLLDRMHYIVAYIFNVALILLVVQLGLFENSATLSRGNVIYITVLAAVVLVLLLLYDYGRQHSFYKNMNRLLQDSLNSDSVSMLQGIRTREQSAFRELIEQHNRYHAEVLVKHRERQRQHVHFINQWVHQMKTPVSVIKLLLQKTKETGSNDTLQPTIDSIGEETDKLAHGLEMMLHTARLDDFALDIKAEHVNIVSIIRDVVHEHKKACIRYSVFPKLQAQKETMNVQTDAKWIRFVFNQLVINAIKYSRHKPGSKTLWVTMDEGDDGVHVTVRDEGAGIPQQDLPRVFDAFFTGENGRTFSESTGMGLFLVKQVCDRLDHGLNIQSEVGEGTAVTVTFKRNRHLHELLP